MFRYATREASQQLCCIYLVFHLMLLIILMMMMMMMIMMMMIKTVFTSFANHYIPIERPVNFIHTFNDFNYSKVIINDNKRV